MSARFGRLIAVTAVLGLVFGCSSDDAAFRRVSRSNPALAWVGDRVFVYGGAPDGEWEARPLADAALWDPATEAYESVAEAPFELPLKPGADAVAVGDAVVLLGTLCETPVVLPDNASYSCPPGSVAAATYDLSENSWLAHELPAALAGFADAYVEGLGATTDDTAVFFLAARGTRLWEFGAEGGWEPLAPLPRPLLAYRGPMCLIGETIVAATHVGREEVRYRLALDAPDPEWRLTASPRDRCGGDSVPAISWPPDGGTEPVVGELRG